MVSTMYVAALTQTYATEVAHVVEYLVTRFGYVVELIVAHSKSVAITYAYASKFCTKPGLHRPPALMAMFSGRFWMSVRRPTHPARLW